MCIMERDIRTDGVAVGMHVNGVCTMSLLGRRNRKSRTELGKVIVQSEYVSFLVFDVVLVRKMPANAIDSRQAVVTSDSPGGRFLHTAMIIALQ